MSHLKLIDDLIREYLVYRGLASSLKAFDADLKTCKDRSYCADRVLDVLMTSVNESRLDRLLSVWQHLEQKVFSGLDTHHQAVARDFGTALMRRYVTHAVSQGPGSTPRVTEFFNRLSPDLQSRPEWKDWFALPFLKNPEENSTFSVFFTRYWQETFAVSLHNFLAAVFHYMPVPTLARYQAESELILSLQRENMDLRSRLENLHLPVDPAGIERGVPHHDHAVLDRAVSHHDPAPADIMDDFIVVAQEPVSASVESTSASKSLRSLIKSIGNSSGQTAVRSTTKRNTDGYSVSVPGASLSSQSSRPVPASQIKSNSSVSSASPSVEYGMGDSGTVLLGQETVSSHDALVNQCLFSPCCDFLLTAGLDKSLRLHNLAEHSCDTVSLDSAVSASCWLDRHKLAFSTAAGSSIKLYDVIRRDVIGDVTAALLPRLDGKRVSSLSCSSSSARLLLSVAPRYFAGPGIVSQLSPADSHAQLIMYDMRAEKEERVIRLADGVCVSCTDWRQSCPLVVVGCTDGAVCVFDSRLERAVAEWPAHPNLPLAGVLAHADIGRIYTMASDDRFVCWSMTRLGTQLFQHLLHEDATSALTDPLCVTSLKAHGVTAARQFALSRDGSHVLFCSVDGGKLHKMTADGVVPSACELKGHRATVVTCDVAANSVCATASRDGVIKASTLLLQD